jgi:hypothetical protein
MKCAVEMGSGVIIYIQGYMKIGTGVEGLLGFHLNNFKGCNVGIIDQKDLCS